MDEKIERQNLKSHLEELGWRLVDEVEYCEFFGKRILYNSNEEEKKKLRQEMANVLKAVGIPRLNMVPINY